ncbi:8964_t:CDS:1, partial [Cetraspora pellucida]
YRIPLLNITNKSRPIHSKHEIIRNAALLNVERNREFIKNKMEAKYKTKRNRTYEPGDLVKIRIPTIDKLKMDRRSLPCKVLQKKPNCDSYQVACKFGILDNWYSANELEPLGTPDYPDLNIVPLTNTLSLREASVRQNLTRPTRNNKHPTHKLQDDQAH